MTRVLVLQGPNLDLLGSREPEIYGHETLDELHARIRAHAESLGLEIQTFQSNHEGALIDRLHVRDFDIAIVNAGGLTHTSVSLRDALLGVQRPFIEVHLSDPSRREAFRQVNFLSDIALSSIVGQGGDGYLLALDAIARARRRGWLEVSASRRRPCAGPRRIDAVDRRIVALLNERTRLGLEVGKAKAAEGRAVRDPDREREVLLRVAAANEGPLPQVDLLALYRRLMSITRRLEAEARRREAAAPSHGHEQPGE
jgi:3-dehydroquinate dehydratase-2